MAPPLTADGCMADWRSPARGLAMFPRAPPGLPRRTGQLPERFARLRRLSRTVLIAGPARPRRGCASRRVRVWPFPPSFGERKTLTNL